jgi:hypothetical protein
MRSYSCRSGCSGVEDHHCRRRTPRTGPNRPGRPDSAGRWSSAHLSWKGPSRCLEPPPPRRCRPRAGRPFGAWPTGALLVCSFQRLCRSTGLRAGRTQLGSAASKMLELVGGNGHIATLIWLLFLVALEVEAEASRTPTALWVLGLLSTVGGGQSSAPGRPHVAGQAVAS